MTHRLDEPGAPLLCASGAPGLVVTDVDSTLICQEVIEELAEAAGTRERVAEITSRAMNGELDFAESLRERVATLAGVPESVFGDVLSAITPTKGARELIDAVHRAGGKFGVGLVPRGPPRAHGCDRRRGERYPHDARGRGRYRVLCEARGARAGVGPAQRSGSVPGDRSPRPRLGGNARVRACPSGDSCARPTRRARRGHTRGSARGRSLHRSGRRPRQYPTRPECR